MTGVVIVQGNKRATLDFIYILIQYAFADIAGPKYNTPQKFQNWLKVIISDKSSKIQDFEKRYHLNLLDLMVVVGGMEKLYSHWFKRSARSNSKG